MLVPEAVSPPSLVAAGPAVPQRSPQIVREPEPGQRRTTPAARSLEGVTVLIIDDDVRNVFALTSLGRLHRLTA